ncbi:MAG: putative shikimate kinase [Planctomycetota bacterium]|jgi:shikimate kinase
MTKRPVESAPAPAQWPWPFVALVGLRASGKTTLARALGERHSMPALDLDARLAERHGAASAGELLSRLGVARFRAAEEALALELLDAPTRGARLWSCGGGLVESPRVRALLARRALVLWLDAPPSVLAARLRRDPNPRPSLLGLPPERELELLAARREGLHRACAHLRLDAAAPAPVVLERALAALARHG